MSFSNRVVLSVTSINLEVVFEGSAVDSGLIDARLLAESLLGYNEVFTRANAILNGTDSEAAVLVRSDFKQGSFVAGLEFAQHIVAEAQQVIAAHPALDTSGLLGLVGFVWKKRKIVETVLDLYRKLRGEKPKEVKTIGGNNIELKTGDNSTIVVNNTVYQLSQDPGIAKGFRRVTEPLRHPEIDRIIVRDGADQVTIDREDAKYLDAEPLTLEANTSPTEGQREAVLIVSKLSFVEGTTWSFIESGATLSAKIEDPEFWANVHRNNLRFGEGDSLRATLHWKVVQTRSGKLISKNTILEVLEVLPRIRPTQMSLQDSTGRSVRHISSDDEGL